MSEPQSCCQANQCRSSLRVSIHSSRIKLFQSRPATGFLRTRDDTAAMFILVVTLPSFAQNIPKPVISNTRRRKLREPKAIRKRTARSLYTARTHRSNESMTTCLFNTSVRANHQHLRSPHHAKTTALFFCCSNGISGTNTQQHLKSALHAVVLGS